MSDDGRRVLKVKSTQAFFFLSKSFLFDTDTTHMHPRADIPLLLIPFLLLFLSLVFSLSPKIDFQVEKREMREDHPCKCD